MRTLTRLAVLGLALLPFLAIPDDGRDIEGVWINGDGDGWIELYIANDELMGKIIGSPDDPEEFKALLAYSPYHNVRQGTAYPPTLISTGDHDDRVYPGEGRVFSSDCKERS